MDLERNADIPRQKLNLARNRLLIAVADELRRCPPHLIKTSQIARSLGLSPSVQNFYFGDRQGLIAHAAVMIYSGQIDNEELILLDSNHSAKSRISSWHSSREAWIQSFPGGRDLIQRPNFYFQDYNDVASMILKGRQRIRELLTLHIKVITNSRDLHCMELAILLEASAELPEGASKSKEGVPLALNLILSD